MNSKTDTALREALRLIQQDADRRPLSEEFYETAIRRYDQTTAQAQAQQQAQQQPQHATPTKTAQPQHETPTTKHNTLWRKAAAAFLGLLLASGIAIAAVSLLNRPTQPAAPSCQVSCASGAAQKAEATPADSIRTFDNTPLSDILAEACKHYRLQLSIADSQATLQRLHLTWNRQQPVEALLATLNDFENISVSLQDSTLIVH